MTYYVFGQDMRKVGARTAIDSWPEDHLMGEAELEIPVPIILDDPEERGDCAPKSGANTFGDIISGAFSLYSTRLCDELKVFGIELIYTPTKIFLPGIKEPLEGYNSVGGVPDTNCLAKGKGYNGLEYFEIDSSKTKGLSLFDLKRSLRIIDERLKSHLETLGLEGVFMVPTSEYGGTLAMDLTFG